MMHELGSEAFKAVCRRTFRIETRWWKQRAVGTGVYIMHFQKSKRIALATAGHLLDFPPNEPVEWLVQQFDTDGNVARQITFTTTEVTSEPTYIRHKTIDIGYVVLPAHDQNGKLFALSDDRPLPVIDVRHAVTEGTPVGWAGFPYQVEQFLGVPKLCYFEGVVSAFDPRTDRPAYIVDGHNAPGVSGGPVWHWPRRDQYIEIIGVVSGFGGAEPSFPGFCVFVPINVVTSFVRTNYKTAESGGAAADSTL